MRVFWIKSGGLRIRAMLIQDVWSQEKEMDEMRLTLVSATISRIKLLHWTSSGQTGSRTTAGRGEVDSYSAPNMPQLGFVGMFTPDVML